MKKTHYYCDICKSPVPHEENLKEIHLKIGGRTAQSCLFGLEADYVWAECCPACRSHITNLVCDAVKKQAPQSKGGLASVLVGRDSPIS